MRPSRALLVAAIAGALLLAGCDNLFMQKNRDQARQRWDQSRSEMITKLAEGCYQRGEYGRAYQHIEVLINAGVTYAPAYVLAARLAEHKGDLDRAHGLAQSATAMDPNSSEARYVLGTIEQMLGHTDLALAEFSEASRLNPNEARYVLAEAELLVSEGHAEEAAEHVAATAKRAPGRAEVHAALGDVLVVVGQYGEAAASYRTALRLDPDLPGIKERLATANYRSGAYGEAEPLLAALADTEPEPASGWAYQMRGDCLMALGRLGEARALFEGRRQAAPASAVPLVGLAKCDILEDRLPSARAHLESALALQPKHPEVNALMGYVLVAEGRPGEALPHLRLALKQPNCEGRATLERLLAQAENLSRSRS
jgi:tetratricopeptide (TPR) repeat protein